MAPLLATWLAAWRRLFRRRSLGTLGERAAAKFLKRRGYKIVARSDRASLGEIDIVAVQGRTLVFIEVKTRRDHDGGLPAEAVDLEKQRRLTRLAIAYSKRHGLLECPSRFDIVSVTWPVNRGRPKIEHLQGAFEARGSGGMYA